MSTQFTNRQWRLPNNENKDKQSNYSMDFDGSSQYIEIAHNSYFDQLVYSFSFWINNNLNSGVSNDGIITADSSTRGWSILQDNQTLKFNPNISGGSGQIDITNFFNTTSTWIHCAITFDGTNLIIYKNGTSVGSSSSGTRNLNSNNNPLIIGNNTFASGRFFNGKIDGVAIFDYALSSSQITTLYGSSSTGIGNPMSLSPKPVAYYPLGDQDAFNGSNYLVPNSSLKGYVFDFDGSNDYIDYGNVDALKLGAGDFTWSSWINPDSWGSSFEALYTCLASNGVWIGIDGTNFVLRIVNGSNIIAYSTLPTVNTWTNICITRVSGACTLYYNGVSVATATSTHNFNVNGNVNLGGYGTYGNFNGKISNVQVFNTALPATGSNSVETLYNNGSPLTSMSGFTSLVSWWKLDASDTYDGTNWTIEDHAGSNDGTSSGMIQANLVQSDLSFTSGYSPYALSFDGVDDYIDCGDTDYLNGVTQMSVSVWFNADIALGGRQGLIGDMPSANYASDNGHFAITAKNNSGNIYSFRIYFIGTDSVQHSINIDNRPFTAGQWHNLVMTYNAGTVNFYVDGSLVPSTIHAGAPIPTSFVTLTNNRPLEIGRWASHVEWDGKISNPSIWNTELTSAQITEIYSEGVPSNLNNHSAYSNLVSWWQLGSNSSFNSSLNQWTCIDEKGTNTGESSQTFNEDAIVDGVGSYANGLSSGMGGDEVVGSAPFSDANSLSINMDVLDRVTDTPS